MEGSKPSVLSLRIYYEDTDCGGVVYYANYLRYFERARTERLRDCGMDLAEWMDRGAGFVVSKAEISYLAPARYSDLLTIETTVKNLGRASVTFHHRVKNQSGLAVADSDIVLVFVKNGRPVRIPAEIASKLV